MITVRVDAEGVTRALAGLADAVQARAINRSLNRAADAGRAEGIRIVRETLNLKAKDVRRVIKVEKRTGAQLADAAIVIEPEDVRMIAYDARQTKPGVTVKVKRGGARRLVRGVFLATMLSGHKGVWRRLPGTIGPRSGREMIHELYSTSPRQLFKRKSAVDRVIKRAAAAFVKAAENQIRQALKGNLLE